VIIPVSRGSRVMGGFPVVVVVVLGRRTWGPVVVMVMRRVTRLVGGARLMIS
jgi:hypothetical protein